MGREVDPRRTRKALRQVNRLREAAQADASRPGYSDWEESFLSEVGQRLETYGSAFADYAKGAPDEALSRLQQQKLKEIAKKARLARRERLKRGDDEAEGG
jgi:hypothetical protein